MRGCNVTYPGGILTFSDFDEDAWAQLDNGDAASQLYRLVGWDQDGSTSKTNYVISRDNGTFQASIVSIAGGVTSIDVGALTSSSCSWVDYQGDMPYDISESGRGDKQVDVWVWVNPTTNDNYVGFTVDGLSWWTRTSMGTGGVCGPGGYLHLTDYAWTPPAGTPVSEVDAVRFYGGYTGA